jgi:hypothetical protein
MRPCPQSALKSRRTAQNAHNAHAATLESKTKQKQLTPRRAIMPTAVERLAVLVCSTTLMLFLAVTYSLRGPTHSRTRRAHPQDAPSTKTHCNNTNVYSGSIMLHCSISVPVTDDAARLRRRGSNVVHDQGKLVQKAAQSRSHDATRVCCTSSSRLSVTYKSPFMIFS